MEHCTHLHSVYKKKLSTQTFLKNFKCDVDVHCLAVYSTQQWRPKGPKFTGMTTTKNQRKQRYLTLKEKTFPTSPTLVCLLDSRESEIKGRTGD